MSEVITRFFDRPTQKQPYLAHGQSLVFLIEAHHAAAAWGVFAHNGTQVTSEYLWFGTPYKDQAAEGPTWFVANPVSTAALADICHHYPQGIALSCSDPTAALAHGRTLLSEGVRGIHNPAVWAALAMESRQPARLFGPWFEVYTPVPSAQSHPRQWHVWSNNLPATAACEEPLLIPDTLHTTFTDIQWLHWLRQHPQAFAQLSDEELPRAVANLNFLVKHGIGVDRDLLQLSPLITGSDLSQRHDLLPLLTSRERPHRRVEQLLQGR
ncbi:MAG: Uncharacterized protein JWP80_1748 [Pseudomonas sp.]|nr:Uncharacterized protein [Pseudomonas sp.]